MTSHLGGSFEWMHTLGFGDLGDPDEEVGMNTLKPWENYKEVFRALADMRDEVQAILGEEHPYGAAQTTGSVWRSAQQAAGQDNALPAGSSAGAAPGAGAATQCAKCGQLALLAVGRCQCEIEVEE